MIVTIDGPAGSGKSTAARGLADRLKFQFLDTGAMYRVVAWDALQSAVDLQDEQAVTRAAEQVEITFAHNRVFANGIDVTEAIRTVDVTQAASVVAMIHGVRREMEKQQRKAAVGANIVTEGRDQGTIVFPNAECKFYLTAEPTERATRRQHELAEQGSRVPLQEIVAQIYDRDERDQNRTVSPLRQADDAIRIDTSRLSRPEVLDELERIVKEKQQRLRYE